MKDCIIGCILGVYWMYHCILYEGLTGVRKYFRVEEFIYEAFEFWLNPTTGFMPFLFKNTPYMENMENTYIYGGDNPYMGG